MTLSIGVIGRMTRLALLLICLALAACCCSVLSVDGKTLSFEEAVGHVKNSLPTALSSVSSTCTITDDNSCPLTNFARDESHLVYPGGQTRCILSTSTPFAFQVVPGDADKLLFYFQGGGACWDALSTDLGLCSQDAIPASLIGAFDRTDVRNKFKDFTIVHALYCSGDVWGGDVVRNYVDSNGVPVTQKGWVNAKSVLDYVQSQQQNGTLASTLSQLVVMGCSAGSIGAQIWSKEILTTLKWNSAAVVPDSYIGVFPPLTQGPLIRDFGFCNAPFLTPALKTTCRNGGLTLALLMDELIGTDPRISFNYIQSKVDIVQRSFYVLIGITMNSTFIISDSEFYADVNQIMTGYNQKHPNFLTYLVDGDQHCFTDHLLYFNADTLGPHASVVNVSASDTATSNETKLFQWCNKFPLQQSQNASTECSGKIETVGDDVTYCSSNVVPKTFVENY